MSKGLDDGLELRGIFFDIISPSAKSGTEIVGKTSISRNNWASSSLNL